MNLELISKWYTLLPAALSIGPVFSLLGIDKFVHSTTSKNGYGKRLVQKNDVTRMTDAIVTGSPFWIAVSSIFLQPFFGGVFPVKYVALLLFGCSMKILFGRSHLDEDEVALSSRSWSPLWSRKTKNIWNEISDSFSNFSYPSAHALATLGSVLTGVSGPASWILVAGVCAWLVLSNRHWTSDVLSAVFLSFAFKDLLG